MTLSKEAAPAAWLDKEAAAKYLKVSVRQIERRAKDGYVRKQMKARKPWQTSATTLYNREDLDAIKAGTPNTYPVVEGSPASMAAATPPTTALATVEGKDPFAQLAAHLASLASAYPSTPPYYKPWLNLAEAAEYCGRSKAFLRRSAERGVSWAQNDAEEGKRKRWMFNRDALQGCL